MSRLPTLILVFSAWSVLPCPTTAQAVQPGSSISVMMQSQNPFDGLVRREVVFDRADRETLWVVTEEGPVSLSLETAAPRVRTGDHHGSLGAVLGLLVGSGIGALVAYSSYQPELVSNTRCEYPWPGAMPRNCRNLGQVDRGSRTAETLGAAGIGFWVGLGGGYLIGRALPKWLPLDPESLRVGPTGVSARALVRSRR